MNISCEKFVLQNAINISSKAAALKSPIPALEGLLLETKNDNTLRITGYDLKKGIYNEIDVTVDEPGSIVLNSRLFGEMIRRMPDGIVQIKEDPTNGMVTISCGKSEYSFMSIDSKDYPELPSIENTDKIIIPQKQLKTMINETIFAVAEDDNRPIYTGILFEIENGMLTLVSVDGYRLALRQESIECSENASFTVPGNTLSDVERICGEEGNAIISIGEKHISFEIGNTVVISRRLEGEFLNYKKAIPENFVSSVVVDKEEFLKSVDRVALIINQKAKNPVRLVFKDGFINIKCTTPIGKAEDFCSFSGNCDEIEIGFNDRYLIDALKAAPSRKNKNSF